ncbi:MAG: ABC transporter substrate-binding protein [Acidobacteriota bacterium]
MHRLFLIILLLCTPPIVASDTDDLSRVVERGTLRVLAFPHQETVFMRRMPELGAEGLHRFNGIDYEIMAAWATELGVELEILPLTTAYSDLIPGLLRGDGDVAATAMSITPARQEVVTFSRPYFQVFETVVTRRDRDVRNRADLEGLRLAVVPGTSFEETVRKLGLHSNVVEKSFFLEMYTAVAEGEADATLSDSISVSRVLAKYPDLERRLKIAFTLPDADQFGYAMRPGSTLKPHLDAFLDRLEASGKLDDIKASYLSSK